MRPVDCLRCKNPMEPGFLVDDIHHGFTVQEWVAGRPARNMLGRLKGPLVAYEVVTFRCEKCGLLESYVPEIRRPREARRGKR